MGTKLLAIVCVLVITVAAIEQGRSASVSNSSPSTGVLFDNSTKADEGKSRDLTVTPNESSSAQFQGVQKPGVEAKECELIFSGNAGLKSKPGSHEADSNIVIMSRLSAGGRFKETGTKICAGGRDDDVHKADVSIRFNPALKAGAVAKVDLQGGGGGAAISAWWTVLTKSSQEKAKLVYGDNTHTHGDGNALEVTAPGGGISRIIMKLWSSNKLEDTSIRVRVGALSKSHVVSFAVPTLDYVMAEGAFDLDKARPFTGTFKFGNHHVAGHTLGVTVYAVTLMNGKRVEANGNSTSLDDAMSEGKNMRKYVHVIDASTAGYGAITRSTPDSGNAISGKIKVVSPDVATFDIGYADLSLVAGSEKKSE